MNEQLFAGLIVLFVIVVITVMQISKNRQRIRRMFLMVLDRLRSKLPSWSGGSRKSKSSTARFNKASPSAEEESKAELERLQKLIEDRKRVARESDISHHLWGFYKYRFRDSDARSVDPTAQFGKWYDVKILSTDTRNGLNRFEFKLKGAKYQFVDDEENKGWADKAKFFSLYLYDDSGRCLIEIPMKVKIDKWGRNYSVLSEGPNAFLPGDWVSDFINVKLKHQRIHNLEIREQKHQERLWEIEDLKDRFGIPD